MKTSLITLLILVQSGFVFAQNTFEKVYQLNDFFFEFGKHVQQTSDGGFLITGRAYRNLDSHSFLFKTDANGDSVWLQSYQIPLTSDSPFKTIETPDGGFLCGPAYGNYFLTGYAHFYLMKTDAEGNKQWEKIFETNTAAANQGSDFLLDSENKIVISGLNVDVDLETDLSLLITDLQGEIIARHIYVHPEDYYPAKIQELNNGGFIVAGMAGQGEELFIQKLDDSFNEEWIKTYPMDDDILSITSLQMIPDGNILITSTIYLWEEDEYKNLIMKIDDSGQLQESIEIDFTVFPVVTSAFMPDENHFVVTGWIEDYWNFNHSVFLSKVTTEGEVIWERYFNVTDDNIGISLNATNDNGYIINANVSNEGFAKQLYLIKTDDQGLISGIENQQSNVSPITIFPNPVTDQLTINLENNIKASEYSIYNIRGQVITSGLFENETISVAQLQNGIYFIELTTNEGILRQKFTK